MSWDSSTGSPSWSPYSYPTGQLPNNNNYYSRNAKQPHYANAYSYAQQGASISQPQITIPSPGFSKNQPMSSLVPPHMRNRTGPARCGHEGCLFAGTHKEVETHKMDRHLIFPPGWEDKQKGKGKRKRDEDEGEYVDEEAQFRASGSAPILGTDMKLDSPEAIAAWLEERKKRWPSAKRVAEKAQTRQEALERGQILTEPPRPHRSTDCSREQYKQPQRGRGRGRGRGQFSHPKVGDRTDNGGSQLPTNDSGWDNRAPGRGRGGRGSGPGIERGRGRGRGRGASTRPPTAPGDIKAQMGTEPSPSSSTESSSGSDSDSDSNSDAESDSGSDMDPIKDAMSSKMAPPEAIVTEVESGGENEEMGPTPAVEERAPTNTQLKKQTFKRTPQPPKPAYNPFNQRPNLLRNLLVPDIQATVSNLSQAIRFLVANDFLVNVELKPGDAENIPIQPMNIDGA